RLRNGNGESSLVSACSVPNGRIGRLEKHEPILWIMAWLGRPIFFGDQVLALFRAEWPRRNCDLERRRRNLFAAPRVALLRIDERFVPKPRAKVIAAMLQDGNRSAPRAKLERGRHLFGKLDILAVERIAFAIIDRYRRV